MSEKFVRHTGKATSKSSSLGFLMIGMSLSIGMIMLIGTFLRPLIQKKGFNKQVGYIDEMLAKESLKEQNIALEDSDFSGDITMDGNLNK